MSIGIGKSNVARVQPIVGIDGAGGRLGIIQIALHDLRTTHANLTFLVWTKLRARRRIDELHLSIRGGGADGPKSHAGRIGRTAVGDRTGFSHAIALTNAALDSVHAFARKLSTQRSGARKD